MTTITEHNPIESTGAILTDDGFCIRLPQECVYTLSQHNLLLIHCFEYKGNYYLKPSGITNNQVLEVMRHTPVAPDI